MDTCCPGSVLKPSSRAGLTAGATPVTARMYRQEEDLTDLRTEQSKPFTLRLEKVVCPQGRLRPLGANRGVRAAPTCFRKPLRLLVESRACILGGQPGAVVTQNRAAFANRNVGRNRAGRSADEAMQLFESSKDRHEHDVVVRSVTERLSSIAETRKNEDRRGRSGCGWAVAPASSL